MARRRKRKSPYHYLRNEFQKPMEKKLALQFTLVMLAFLLLIGRVVYINIVNGEEYTIQVLNQQSSSDIVIPYKRGDILDTNGTVLATSDRVYNVILDTKLLLGTTEKSYEELSETEVATSEAAVAQTVEVLVEVFGLNQEELEQKIEDTTSRQYTVLVKNVDYETAQLYDEYKNMTTEEDGDTKVYPYLRGITLEEGYQRSYPYGSLASTVIGYANSNNLGIVGLEAYYSDTLNGTDGKEYSYYEGTTVQTVVEEADNGDSIMLTVDQTVQSIVEKHIDAFNETYENGYTTGAGSANIAVLITNPNTGEIIASANSPSFDLSNPSDLSEYYTTEEISAMTEEEESAALNALRNNFTVSSTFEPGSTFKVFTVAAALETGAISTSDLYYCDGSTEIGGYTINCANGAVHGTQTLTDAFANSCNVALIEVAENMGIEDFTKYQSIFGFGDYTNIDVPSEVSASSLIYTVDTMTSIDLATNSFGQSFNVTMIQMMAAFNSVINGGYYYEPYIVKQIIDDSGSVVTSVDSTLVKKTISESTSELMCQYLEGVVEDGTGNHVDVEGYSVGGKTGTAEKLPRGEGTYVVSFIGCVPADDPEISIYVVIDEPNAEEQGTSRYAQVLASDILNEVLPYLGVTKDESSEITVSEIVDDEIEVSEMTEDETVD